jgi:NAD:arginine ADP-ribosyltransferase
MGLEYYVKTHFPDSLQRIITSKRADELLELTVYEKAIIFAYTDTVNNQHQALNQTLWASEGAEISDFGLHFENCLDKLESVMGVFYRGAKESYCDINRYIKAKENKTIITEYHFLSVTASQITARGFGNILFRIYGKNAKKIEKVSKFEKEQESIFKRNTQFKVTGVTNNGLFTTITLKEI